VMVEKPVVAPAPTHASPAETSVGDRDPDPVEAPVAAPVAPHPDDKTGKSDVASS